MNRSLHRLAPAGFVTAGREDVHVHTDACDDATQSAASALAAAVEAGLNWVCLTAHVRLDTPATHVREFLRAGQQASEGFGDLALTFSVETKLLNASGDLDLPADLGLDELDTLHIADHRFPLDRPTRPTEVRQLLLDGHLTETAAWQALTDATCAALAARPGSILAHPLSIIPKVGMDPARAPAAAVAAIAAAAARHGALVEINNKWSSPTVELITECVRRGVPVVSASDAHHCGEVGQRQYLDRLLAELPSRPHPTDQRQPHPTLGG